MEGAAQGGGAERGQHGVAAGGKPCGDAFRKRCAAGRKRDRGRGGRTLPLLPVVPEAPRGNGTIPCDEAEEREGEDIDAALRSQLIGQPAEHEGADADGQAKVATPWRGRCCGGRDEFRPWGGEASRHDFRAPDEEGRVAGRVMGGASG